MMRGRIDCAPLRCYVTKTQNHFSWSKIPNPLFRKPIDANL